MGHFAVMTRLVNNQACSSSHSSAPFHSPLSKRLLFSGKKKAQKIYNQGLNNFILRRIITAHEQE